jgi:Tat protein translocase TatB subunit
MFGIGMPEMILILAVALIVIGPKKLPDLAKSMGRALGEFRKAATDFKESMEIDTQLKDVKKAFDTKELMAKPESKSSADSPPEGEKTSEEKGVNDLAVKSDDSVSAASSDNSEKEKNLAVKETAGNAVPSEKKSASDEPKQEKKEKSKDYDE